MNGRPVDVQNDARPSAAARESSPSPATNEKQVSEIEACFCVFMPEMAETTMVSGFFHADF